jgi:hypothetical protein
MGHACVERDFFGGRVAGVSHEPPSLSAAASAARNRNSLPLLSVTRHVERNAEFCRDRYGRRAGQDELIWHGQVLRRAVGGALTPVH